MGGSTSVINAGLFTTKIANGAALSTGLALDVLSRRIRRFRHHSEAALSLDSLRAFLQQQERSHLQRALEQSGGDKEKAALLLGISLATLYRKISGEEREG